MTPEQDAALFFETVNFLWYVVLFGTVGALILTFLESIVTRTLGVASWILSAFGNTIGFFLGILVAFGGICYGFYFLSTLIF